MVGLVGKSKHDGVRGTRRGRGSSRERISEHGIVGGEIKSSGGEENLVSAVVAEAVHFIGAAVSIQVSEEAYSPGNNRLLRPAFVVQRQEHVAVFGNLDVTSSAH
jgi:hypothetical protein